MPGANDEGLNMIVPVALSNMGIRRKRHNGEWWFAVDDVLRHVDGQPGWRGLLAADEAAAWEGGGEVGSLCQGLAFAGADGAVRQVEGVTLEGVFRIVQSVATPRAEGASGGWRRLGGERGSRKGSRPVLIRFLPCLVTRLLRLPTGRLLDRKTGISAAGQNAKNA
ncbi:MAG: hypothetical protein A2505_06235 [Deltaproteobacteria bacterium RIFOXYD12_FULL_55_16]|nr:MAG: hypothetical protein A2505_06235 [Deltaproteobacteria bacterium RIFOXYD12_FULL_55_16]